MKTLLLVLLAGMLCTACTRKDENGNPTAESFSLGGMLRPGGDVSVGGH